MTTRKPTHTTKELLWGRIAAKTVYFMLGAGSGTFAATIPRLKDSLQLSAGSLGLALLFCSAGGFIAMQFAAPLIKRYGLRLLLSVLAPLFPLIFILIALANNLPALAGAFMVFGALTSIVGIAVNAHAIDIERAYARSIMSSFHALFSIGGLVGAGVGGVAAAGHLTILQSLGVAAAGLSLIGVLVISKLFDVTRYDYLEDHTVIEAAHRHHKSRWWQHVLLIGSLLFICFLCEGAISDWSALYLKNVHQAGPIVAVLAYIVFNSCMTVGRLTGDSVIRRVGGVPTLAAGGIVGSAGLVLGLLSPSIIMALVGFGIVGLGLSVLVPILISMAGNVEGGDRNVAIARASACGSIGLMVGPAAIGFLAQQYSLLVAMLLPVALLIILTTIALTMRSLAKSKYRNLGIVD